MSSVIKKPGARKSVEQQSLAFQPSRAKKPGGALDAEELQTRAPGGSHEIAKPLLAWFRGARRALPWRIDPRDPYKTWLSEVMLQQTRVETMVPYFHRFLARFPTLQSLAEAPQDDVLALWSGLGYYARARNLHRAAQEAFAKHGALPKTLDELRALPGFGPYTSAAVASLAFGVDAALVDGNVARVLARALGLEGDVDRAKLRSWELAPGLLPKGKAGEFNEALMELGAMICTPRSPACSRCPIAEGCVARERGNPEEVPAARPRKARPLVIRAALRLQRDDGRVLLQRQPGGALFEGLWDLPALEVGAEDPDSVRAAAAKLGRELGAKGEPAYLARVEQALTHREMRVEIFALTTPKKDPAKDRPELRWASQDKDALALIGLSSLARKSLIASGSAVLRSSRLLDTDALGDKLPV